MRHFAIDTTIYYCLYVERQAKAGAQRRTISRMPLIPYEMRGYIYSNGSAHQVDPTQGGTQGHADAMRPGMIPRVTGGCGSGRAGKHFHAVPWPTWRFGMLLYAGSKVLAHVAQLRRTVPC